MQNNTTLRDAIEAGYAQELWLKIIDTEEKALARYNELINGNAQIIELIQLKGPKTSESLLFPRKIETIDDNDRETKLIELIKETTKALKDNRIILEGCLALGKNTTPNKENIELDPWNADKIDEGDILELSSIIDCVMDDMLKIIKTKCHTTIRKMKPEHILTIYHWDKKNEEDIQNCAHFHILISCKIQQKKEKK